MLEKERNMRRKEKEELLFHFIKEQKHNIFQKVVYVLVFCTIFFLYDLPLEPCIYAGILCLVIDVIFMCIAFSQYVIKYRDLERLKAQNGLGHYELQDAEGKIEECYQEIVQRMAEQQQQLLYQKDKETTELLDYYTMWVHQIKTPIARMQLLLTEAKFSEKKDVEIALFEIEQYAEIVLQSIRLFSDSTDFVLKQYVLDDIVRQAVRKHAKVFISKKIALDFKGCPIEVLTDEKWLLFVIEQIISNALKYTKTGTISIYLDKSKEKTLVIEDTGIGIYAEDLPRVFEKGFTGYNGREDKKSTGIGLYLCKRVLDKMTHTISIETEVGKGTKIRLGLASVQLENRYE